MHRPAHRRAIVTIITIVCASMAAGQVELPGTPPLARGLRVEALEQCTVCHSKTASGQQDPHASWQAGLMSLASKDPLFRAAMSIANQDVPDVGSFCLRCHTPRGFFEGRTMPADGAALKPEDLHGVTCAICHKLIDPRTPRAAELVPFVPPGLGNGMMVLDKENRMQGVYGDNPGLMMRPHTAEKSAFLLSGDACGTCHDVSNPLLAEDVRKQPPHTFGHIERTYSEWKLSDFARQGPDGSCLVCHYPQVAGGGYPSRFPDNPKRERFGEHGPVGGSTWVQEAIWRLWDGQDMDRAALERGQQKAREFLRTAATLELTFTGTDRARLRITNLTGHKLPTGYPEGRRMWVQARYYDAAGNVLDEIGKYGEREFTVGGQTLKLPTLLDPEQTRVYECLPAISEAQAKKYGKAAGKSFFFVLNDYIAKDNRIPPKGFANAAFAERGCAPVDATYADGQHWDDVELLLPAGTAKVEVRLMYQSASAEYMVFLAEEDRTGPWGRRVFDVWRATEHCPPEVIAETTAQR